MEDNKIKEINFNGNVYAIEDLTPRAIEGFNALFKAQQKLNDLAVEVKIVQGGQSHLSAELEKVITEDKIKPQPPVEEEKTEK